MREEAPTFGRLAETGGREVKVSHLCRSWRRRRQRRERGTMGAAVASAGPRVSSSKNLAICRIDFCVRVIEKQPTSTFVTKTIFSNRRGLMGPR